jgi:hypothetical protein
VAALLLLPHPAAGDERRDGLIRTRERLGEVETVLRNARADAGTVAQALAAADRAVARSRARLATATAELDRALGKQAKDKLDARVARLAGAAGALRRRSAELRRLIRQEKLARRRAGRAGRGSILGPGPPCDRDRYGTAERAKAFWQANGWY